MYDKESLSSINARFLSEHFICRSDVELANKWIRIIENSRRPDRPVIGDIVRLATKYGDYYDRAHIDVIGEDGNAHVCEQPYVPFIHEADNPIGFGFSTSGGAWLHCGTGRMTPAGQELKRFCDWGSCGACRNGAIEFMALVNVWEYADPNPVFGKYTTRDWAKRYVHIREPENECGYRYAVTCGSLPDTAFRTEDEYKSWLLTYKAVEFKGHWPNQSVVFLYKTERYLVSEDEWAALPLPTDTRLMNASVVPVKYRYDDDAHVIHEYRYTNRSREDRRLDRLYRAAAEKIRANGYKRVIHPQTK